MFLTPVLAPWRLFPGSKGVRLLVTFAQTLAGICPAPGKDALRHVGCFTSKAGGGIQSCGGAGVEAMGEATDDVLNPDAGSFLLAEVFDCAEALEEGHEDSHALCVSFECRFEVVSKLVKVAVLQFQIL